MDASKCVEGYWASKPNDKTSKYPWPEADSGGQDQDTLVAVLERVEKALSSSGIGCLTSGYSPCRLCDKAENGSAELQCVVEGTHWSWPQGLLHYLRDHRVAPSDKFAELLRNGALLKAAEGNGAQDAVRFAEREQAALAKSYKERMSQKGIGSDPPQEESTCLIM